MEDLLQRGKAIPEDKVVRRGLGRQTEIEEGCAPNNENKSRINNQIKKCRVMPQIVKAVAAAAAAAAGAEAEEQQQQQD